MIDQTIRRGRFTYTWLCSESSRSKHPTRKNGCGCEHSVSERRHGDGLEQDADARSIPDHRGPSQTRSHNHSRFRPVREEAHAWFPGSRSKGQTQSNRPVCRCYRSQIKGSHFLYVRVAGERLHPNMREHRSEEADDQCDSKRNPCANPGDPARPLDLVASEVAGRESCCLNIDCV